MDLWQLSFEVVLDSFQKGRSVSTRLPSNAHREQVEIEEWPRNAEVKAPVEGFGHDSTKAAASLLRVAARLIVQL